MVRIHVSAVSFHGSRADVSAKGFSSGQLSKRSAVVTRHLAGAAIKGPNEQHRAKIEAAATTTLAGVDTQAPAIDLVTGQQCKPKCFKL